MKQQNWGDCAALCMELSLFFASGMDFALSFTLLAEKAEQQTTAEAMARAAEALAAGETLSAVLAKNGLLPKEGVELLAVAEKTGRVEEALNSLARYYRRREENARTLRAAVTYPAVLFLVMISVVLVLITKVLPVFSDIYASVGGEMGPFATSLCAFGAFTARALPSVLWALIALAAVALLCAAVKPLRVHIGGFFQKLFSRTKVSRTQATAQFADALSMALCSGFTPAQAMESAVPMLYGTGLSAQAHRALEQIAAGEEPMDVLRICGLLPADECNLLTLGLAGGAVEKMAEECARRAYSRAEDSLTRAVSSIEPIIVVITSLLVGTILLAVLFPLAELLSAIG